MRRRERAVENEKDDGEKEMYDEGGGGVIESFKNKS